MTEAQRNSVTGSESSRDPRESVAKSRETPAPGTEEQRNRGTGEQGNIAQLIIHVAVGNARESGDGNDAR